MKLLSMKSGAFTCLTAGWLLAASLGAHAAPTVEVDKERRHLADLYMECADGTRIYALQGGLLHPELCDDHGGVKGGGGGIGGGHDPRSGREPLPPLSSSEMFWGAARAVVIRMIR